MHAGHSLSSSSRLDNPQTEHPRGQLDATKHIILLDGTVPALSELTVVSNRIAFPYDVQSLTIHFPLGCDNLVRIYPILALDDSVSTSGLPPGTNFLSPRSPLEYLIGDDVTFPLYFRIRVSWRGTYLKAHIINADASPHYPSCLFTILEIPRGK